MIRLDFIILWLWNSLLNWDFDLIWTDLIILDWFVINAYIHYCSNI